MGSSLNEDAFSVKVEPLVRALNGPVNAGEFIEILSRAFANVPDRQKDATTIHIYQSFMDDGLRLEMSYRRSLTDDEKEARNRRMKEVERAEEESERAEYERLRAKFGDATPPEKPRNHDGASD
jgi:hypothetical protein